MADFSDSGADACAGGHDSPAPADGIDLGGGLVLAADKMAWSYSRAAGPGGQNVNRRATRVSLRVAMAELEALIGAEAARRLRRLAGSRVTEGDDLLIHCDEHRTQRANRRGCIERLAELVRRARIRPKRRIPTRIPPRIQRRRLESKRKRAGIKRQRGRPGGDEHR